MIVVCDLETTSTDVFSAEIIHGHFIALNDELEVVSEFSLRCNPFRYSDEAYTIHGISREECGKYKRFSQVYKDLINWFLVNNIKEFWCHANAAMYGKITYYDWAVLRINLINMGSDAYFSISNFKVFSTHTLCKVYASQYNFTGFSLNEICSLLKIELQHHNAESDSMACVEIMRRLTIDREELYKFERGIKDEHEGTVRSRGNAQRKREGFTRNRLIV